MTAIAQKENHFRLYSLAHFYLSSIQQGLQATRIAGGMIAKYPEHSPQRLMLREWATTGMDTKLLNGGNTADLKKWHSLFEYFENEGMDLPYTMFFESEDNFGGAMTSIGLLVPREIYEHPSFYQLNLGVEEMCQEYPNTPQWHLHLIYSLRSCQLAR